MPDEEREAFETAAQCAHPGYYIREQGPNGTFIPAKHRPEHFPVYYNEPYKVYASVQLFLGYCTNYYRAMKQQWD